MVMGFRVDSPLLSWFPQWWYEEPQGCLPCFLLMLRSLLVAAASWFPFPEEWMVGFHTEDDYPGLKEGPKAD